MRRVLLVIVVAGCGAGVQDGNPFLGDDEPEPPDAIDAAIDSPPDASFLASCITAGYSSVAGLSSAYRAVTASDSWLAAKADCADDVLGATHLVVLSSQAEVDFIVTQRGWVGLSDLATEGTFLNVTNEPNDLRPFANDQPDNGSGNENCVQMKPEGLDDDQCNSDHTYVCECDGVPEAP